MKGIRKKVIVFLSIATLGCATISAQTSTVDVDALYKQARDLYNQEEFTIALDRLNQSLLIAPEYVEIRQLRIRVLQQLRYLKKAEEDILILLKTDSLQDSKNRVLEQLTLINDAKELERFSYLTQPFFVNDVTFLIVKAEQLITLKSTQLAKETISEILNLKNLTSDQKYRLQLLIKKTYSNQLGVNHEVLSFLKDNPVQKSWNTTSVQYQHYFGHHAVIARINYSDRFTNEGALYELEAYPVFSEKWYGFINLNASNTDFYQNYGVSMSSFHALGKGFEGEGGFRYFDFDTNDFFSMVIGVTKYTGKFYLNGRAFLGPKKEDTFIQNYQFNIRYYLENPEDYLFVRLGVGISPDDRTRFTQIAANPDLTARYASLGIQKSIKKYSFQTSVSYLTEDLSNNRNGNQIAFNLGINYRF
ncbi:YaiO family outer membrane beta-barrel protein [uncultured Dokdonia sp.]|uniref:YaiO family outer membrane beta-barrel protein n=1 Tax=uncultured Dokdonia sp. TaxID=575653 RepID=UPI0026322EE1|nr:YaiO family outer membrane beta-barrel protein [uncultured Dokdonia sp.]